MVGEEEEESLDINGSVEGKHAHACLTRMLLEQTKAKRSPMDVLVCLLERRRETDRESLFASSIFANFCL